MDRIRTAFEYADTEAKGELSKHRYKIAMTALFGDCPDKYEIQEIFQNPSKNSVSYDEFLHWARKKDFINNPMIDAKTLFALLDNDYKGRVDVLDFYSATERTDLKISKSMWRKAFKEMDRSRKGFLSLDDLALIINGNVSKFTD